MKNIFTHNIETKLEHKIKRFLIFYQSFLLFTVYSNSNIFPLVYYAYLKIFYENKLQLKLCVQKIKVNINIILFTLKILKLKQTVRVFITKLMRKNRWWCSLQINLTGKMNYSLLRNEKTQFSSEKNVTRSHLSVEFRVSVYKRVTFFKKLFVGPS